MYFCFFFFFQAEDGIRDWSVTGVQTCALPIYAATRRATLDREEPAVDAPAWIHGVGRGEPDAWTGIGVAIPAAEQHVGAHAAEVAVRDDRRRRRAALLPQGERLDADREAAISGLHRGR